MIHGSMKILIIADALESCNLASDTSLAIAQGALATGAECYWCEDWQIGLSGAELVVLKPQRLLTVSAHDLRVEAGSRIFELRSFAKVFVRKDPPFDESYKDLCWLLSTQVHTPIINAAESLATFHEKSLQFRALEEGFLADHNVVPSCVADAVELIEEFCRDQENTAQAFLAGMQELHLAEGAHSLQFVCKPWLGHGGQGVVVYDGAAPLLEALQKRSVKAGRLAERVVVQPFLPEIHTAGDRRVLIVNGQVFGDFVRLPAEGKIASNLAQGGSAHLRPMTTSQSTLMLGLAGFLLAKGIILAGVDLIGDRVGEINITSPTGLRTLETLKGRALTTDFFAQLHAAHPKAQVD